MRTKNKTRPTRRSHIEELDGGEAFVHDYRHGFRPIREGDVEAFGEEFVAGATSNDAVGELARDESYAEELGGFAFDRYEDLAFDRADFI
jgi:hypothetical protein